MYTTSLIYAPLPSVLSNMAAVMLLQGMYIYVVCFCPTVSRLPIFYRYYGAEIYCTRTILMRECLSDNMLAKVYYRRAVARRLLNQKGELLRDALAGACSKIHKNAAKADDSSDAENASRLAPTNNEIADEVKKITEMLAMTKSDVMDRIQEQRRAENPPLTVKMVMMDEDAQQGTKDARVKCTTRYPPTYDYRTEKPPGWKI